MTHQTIFILVTALLGFLYFTVRQSNRSARQQHAKLVKSEERLELAMSVANDGIWDWNLHDNIAEFDARYYTMAGYAPNEFPSTVEEQDKRIHPADLQHTRQALEQFLTGEGKTYDIEFRYLRKDGDYMWVRAQGEIVSRDEQGKPLRFVGTRTDISKRKQSEDALKESEAFAHLLLDSSPTGLALCRMDGTLTDVNPAFSRIIGRRVEESLGLTYADLTPDDYRAQDRVQLACLEQNGHCGPYEKEFIHQDGHRVPVCLNGRIIERAGQRFIWTAIEDLSVARASEVIGNRLHNILQHSFDEIYIFASDTLRFTQVSSGALENLGYSMDELREMTALDLKPDFSHASFNALLEPLRSGITPQLVFETRHQRKDGSYYPVEVRLQLSRQEVEPVFFAIIVDLTERKRSEAELALHRRHLEQLVEERTSTIKQQTLIINRTHDSVITTDRNGFVTSWNGGAERIFGLSADQALGRHIDLIYPDNQQTLLHDEILPNMEANGVYEGEITLRRANGSEFPARLTLMPLYDDDGAPVGRVGYTMDLSELKHHEAELDRLANRLQAANKELESFAYSVSHDLRAPLRAIDGFSLALVEDYGERLDETAHNYLLRIRKGAQHMGELIDDLLQLSLVSRGELALEDVDLSAIAQSILAQLQAGEPERRLQLTLGKAMRVRGDPRLLRVMLDNLLGNAWKFTARQAISHITFQRQGANAEVFLISDNGVGFDMRHAGKLFGAFQRLHRSSDFPGTGVGLATVQRIVNRHGGKIWAEAHEGQGAAFYFTLRQQGAMEKP